MTKYSFLISIALVLILFQPKRNKNIKAHQDVELEELFYLMQGSFNSERQAKTDSSYYNISLHMYPIWKNRGKFLYVEQALNSMQNKPYRQRIYELKRLSDNSFASVIYTLDNDSTWIGKWKTPKEFDALSINEVHLKAGCEVILQRHAKEHYTGQTADTTCASNLRGAAYARSQVEITKNKIISWDRGFDAKGNHVWGAEKGGYIFNKIDY